MTHYEDEYYYNEHDVNQVKKILKNKKKRKLKRRIKIIFFLLVLIFIAGFMMSDLSKVKSIEIVGNDEVKSENIINNISLNDQSVYFLVDKKKLTEEIKNIGMIKRASVSIDLIGNVTIEIEEAEKVAYCEIDKQIYIIDELGGVSETDDKDIIESLKSCPRLSNFTDLEFLKTFAKEYVKIPEIIKTQTSDIVHSPEKADETRLEFIMDNGKIIYVRVEDMVDQLNRFDYEASITKYKDSCIFNLEGNYLYLEPCQ